MAEETQQHIITADTKDKKQRMDKCLARHIPTLSRSFIQKLIEQGYALLNDEMVVTQPSRRVMPDDTITLTVPPPESTEMLPANIPLSIIYEDNAFLVIDKPAGMTVHPGAGNYQDTMANALLHHCGDSLSGIGGVQRPGIVHRLDKDTSGLILAAKCDAAHHSLSEQIASRSAKRTYLAFCWGTPKQQEGAINANIGRHPQHRQKMSVVSSGGKTATTHYRVIQNFGTLASLIECRLETGRTHQIRVHMTHIGYPLIGDPSYGRTPAASNLPDKLKSFLTDFDRQALHSWKLKLAHPITNDAVAYESPLPDDLKSLQEILEGVE
jgi:23S rRNA pseudouridine1911/1915/1917 synthase